MSEEKRYLFGKCPPLPTTALPRLSLESSGLEQLLELTFATRPCHLPNNTSDLAFVAVDPSNTSRSLHWLPVHVRVSDGNPTHKFDTDNVAVPSLGLLIALDLAPHQEGRSVLVRAPDALSIPTARLVRYERVSLPGAAATHRESGADGELIRACLAGQVVWGGAVVNVGSQQFKLVDALADIPFDDNDNNIGGKTREGIVTSAFKVPVMSTSSNLELDDVVSFVRYESDNIDKEEEDRGNAKSKVHERFSSKGERREKWPPLEAQAWAEQASQCLGGVGLVACRRLTEWMADSNSGGAGHLGAVVWGLPGAGKRSLVRAVAQSAGLAVLELDPRDAFCEQIGAGEEHISVLLNKAVSMSPCVVLVNSVELLAPPVAARGNAEQRLCAVLMSALDSLAAGSARVLVVGTTSHRDGVDPELLTGSRLSVDVPLSPPTSDERVKILSALVLPIMLTTCDGVIESVDKEVLVAEIARRANGFVRADLEGLVREAFMWHRQNYPQQHQPEPQEKRAPNCLSAEALLNGLNAVQPHTMRAIGRKEDGADYDNEEDTELSVVAGLHTARAQMIEAVVMPLRHSVVLAKRGVGAPKGVLFYGPSGNGKTALSRELQRILKHEGLANFVSVPCSSLISKQVGGSEAAVVDAFARARRAAPCVLFLDQIEAIAPRRGFDSSSEQTFDRILSCLLTEMDGILNKDDGVDGTPQPPVILVAATDKVEALDAAILRPGRFDQIIKVDRPNALERADLIDHFLSHTPVVNSSESDSVLPQIVAMTVGWSAAELEGVCRESVLECLRRDIQCEALDLALLLDAVVAVCECT